MARLPAGSLMGGPPVGPFPNDVTASARGGSDPRRGGAAVGLTHRNSAPSTTRKVFLTIFRRIGLEPTYGV
jgi:hypothetical protein